MPLVELHPSTTKPGITCPPTHKTIANRLLEQFGRRFRPTWHLWPRWLVEPAYAPHISGFCREGVAGENSLREEEVATTTHAQCPHLTSSSTHPLPSTPPTTHPTEMPSLKTTTPPTPTAVGREERRRRRGRRRQGRRGGGGEGEGSKGGEGGRSSLYIPYHSVKFNLHP